MLIMEILSNYIIELVKFNMEGEKMLRSPPIQKPVTRWHSFLHDISVPYLKFCNLEGNFISDKFMPSACFVYIQQPLQ